MKDLSLLLKPASGACNMRCGYCFYRDVAAKREGGDLGLMSEETARAVVDKAFSGATGSVGFCFQGGEPTLAGLKFFEDFVNYAEKNKKNISTSYSIQTNGLLLDGQWAAFFKRNRFLVGLSMDGTRDIHDHMRRDAAGEGTFARVEAAAVLLEKEGVDFNILSVITGRGAAHVSKTLNFFAKKGYKYLQLIPCLDGLDGGAAPYSLGETEFYRFLSASFDFYYRRAMSGGYVSIRYFDNLVSMLKGRGAEQCGMEGVCRGQFVVESDGGVYPCDFYCTGDYYSGNIRDLSFSQIAASENYLKFLSEGAFCADCAGCPASALCRGGCRRYAVFEKTRGRSRYCGAYKRFFAENSKKLVELAAYFK